MLKSAMKFVVSSFISWVASRCSGKFLHKTFDRLLIWSASKTPSKLDDEIAKDFVDQGK